MEIQKFMEVREEGMEVQEETVKILLYFELILAPRLSPFGQVINSRSHLTFVVQTLIGHLKISSCIIK